MPDEPISRTEARHGKSTETPHDTPPGGPQRPGACRSHHGRRAHHHLRARDRQQADPVGPQVSVGQRAVRLRPGRAEPARLLGQSRALPGPDHRDLPERRHRAARGRAHRPEPLDPEPSRSGHAERRGRRPHRRPAAAASPPLHRPPDAGRRRPAEGAGGPRAERDRQGAPVRGPARLGHPEAHPRLPSRRERLLLRPRPPRGDAPQRARADRVGGRSVRGDRAQPGLDGRLRRAPEPRRPGGGAAVHHDRLPARHHRGAGPGQAADRPAGARGARGRPAVGERGRSAGPGCARQGSERRVHARRRASATSR